MEPRFVDIHSHVVPSGDDGVQAVSEGLALGRDAFEHGTRVLYATPHVSPYAPPLDSDRERLSLELRLGYELTPMPFLLDEDPRRYVLEQTEHVLVEIPFLGSADLFLEVGEWIENAGLMPVVAHPERTEAVLTNPRLAEELAERGWPLQVNASSLVGRHTPEMEREGWRLIDEGLAALVASDGHRATRPMLLDEAYELTRTRVGEERALRLFDGTALGLAAEPSSSRSKASQTPSPAVSPSA